MFCLQNKYYSLPVMLLISIFCSNVVHAATKSKQQTLEIQAQYLMLDENKGIGKYKGNVILTKDTLIIKADTVTLYYQEQKLMKALITGAPADIQHQPDNEEKVHSQANNMEFFVEEDRLILKGNAFVDQGNRHFSGEYIEYDTRQRTITAAGNQSGNSNTKDTSATNTKNVAPPSRVHVIIGPTEDVKNTSNNEKKIETIDNE